MVFLPNPARLRMLLVKAPAPNQNCRNSNGNGTGRRPGLATEDSRNPHLSREGVAESYNEDNSPYPHCLRPCEQPCRPPRDQATTIAGGRERGKSTGVPTCCSHAVSPCRCRLRGSPAATRFCPALPLLC